MHYFDLLPPDLQRQLKSYYCDASHRDIDQHTNLATLALNKINLESGDWFRQDMTAESLEGKSDYYTFKESMFKEPVLFAKNDSREERYTWVDSKAETSTSVLTLMRYNNGNPEPVVGPDSSAVLTLRTDRLMQIVNRNNAIAEEKEARFLICYDAMVSIITVWRHCLCFCYKCKALSTLT
jgi:hypothetical protein